MIAKNDDSVYDRGMNQPTINSKIQEITQKIVKEYHPEKIILFGSYAWGKPGSDSDVDLLVVKNSQKPRLDRQRELRRKLYPPLLPTDILVYTPKEVEKRLSIGDFFIRDIIAKGKILYGSSK